MHVLVSHSQQKRSSVVLEPAVSFMEQHGLIIARSVCSMEKGSSIIWVLNPSPAPKKDAQPLPRRDDTLGTAQWFSTLDLTSGFWQVEVETGDHEKTTLILPLHMGCISSVPCHVGFVMPLEHSNNYGARPGRITLDVMSGLFK